MFTKKDLLTIQKRIINAYLIGEGSNDTTIIDNLDSVENTKVPFVIKYRNCAYTPPLVEIVKKHLKITTIDESIEDDLTSELDVYIFDIIAETIDFLSNAGLIKLDI